MSIAALERAAEPQLAELTIRPLQPTIGAEIGGVDLSRPISDATRDEIKAAILSEENIASDYPGTMENLIVTAPLAVVDRRSRESLGDRLDEIKTDAGDLVPLSNSSGAAR